MKQLLRKFYPSLYVDEISEIPLIVKEKRIQGLIIDLDNTIAPGTSQLLLSRQKGG